MQMLAERVSSTLTMSNSRLPRPVQDAGEPSVRQHASSTTPKRSVLRPAASRMERPRHPMEGCLERRLQVDNRDPRAQALAELRGVPGLRHDGGERVDECFGLFDVGGVGGAVDDVEGPAVA